MPYGDSVSAASMRRSFLSATLNPSAMLNVRGDREVGRDLERLTGGERNRADAAVVIEEGEGEHRLPLLVDHRHTGDCGCR